MLDLFSGIGGFSLAASWAGIETVAFCERDTFCQKVLSKHWPAVPIVDDIFKLRGDEFGPVDIVSGGFPCQPFSVAGKREGVGDDRFLWPEMLRIIKTARPTWVLGENVAGIINMALDDVLSDLEGIGYATQALVIPACAIDAKHRRDRVWIIAHAEHDAGCSEQLTKSREWENQGPQQNSVLIGSGNHVAHADSQSCTTRSEQPMVGRTPQTARFGECSEDVSDPARELLNRDGSPRYRSAEPSNGGGRTAKPGLGECFNGLSSKMDGGGVNGAPIGNGTDKVLCEMRKKDGKETVQFTVGGFGGVYPAQILRTGLHGECLCQKCAMQRRLVQSSSKIPWRELRIMWGYDPSSSPSHRREQTEQLKRKYPDLMHQLSCYTPPPCSACWSDNSWEDDIPRTGKGIENRTQRLKALGNAIVPQVAYQIFKAMAEVENKS